jgi:hypothetical protein
LPSSARACGSAPAWPATRRSKAPHKPPDRAARTPRRTPRSPSPPDPDRNQGDPTWR